VLSRLGYILRETSANLRRNVTLTLASLITVFVSLTLVGLSFLIQKSVDHALARWNKGVEFIVFLNPDATADQIAAIGSDLKTNPQVKSITYFDKQQAYAEFKQLYPDQKSAELVGSLTVDQMPPSYRVVPQVADVQVIRAIGNQFEKKPGVFQVQFSPDAVKSIRSISQFSRVGALAMGFALLASATMLIWTTIRTAMFARRREIEVMKLVGATNWFIRVPFMLEGLLQGLFGAAIACVFVWLANWGWTNKVVSSLQDQQLSALRASTGEVRLTFVLLLGLGSVLGAVGSGIAVTRFLDV
jgi:cell division transport system permease protein